MGAAAGIPVAAALLVVASFAAPLALAAPPLPGVPGEGEPARERARTVVVLLFDGWAPSMMDGVSTPTMDRLRAEGVWTHRFEPVFPTLSFPNQVSISTGCWPGSHGILSNVFLDPVRGRYDHGLDADWLTGCTHLHEVAERQGVRAAALGWVGRFSGTRGDLATDVPAEQSVIDYPDDAGRAAQVVALLRRDSAIRPGLVLAYFRGPDDEGHFTGVDSRETRAAVEASDRLVGTILDAIEALPDRDRVALLVTTDHGMAPVSKVINLKRILARRDVEAEVISSGTTSFLYFDEPSAADRAAGALAGDEAYDVFRKGALPAEWHLGNGPRVPDLILSARPPWFIEDVERWPWWARWLGSWGPERLSAFGTLRASHGYPPDVPGMHGIFYARGADLPAGRELEGMRAIDVHPLVASLLGLAPGDPIDGRIPPSLVPETRSPPERPHPTSRRCPGDPPETPTRFSLRGARPPE